jgi:hypothetical protein
VCGSFHGILTSAMLSDSYQGGASIELFSPHGRDPMAACKVTNGAAGVRKEFDKNVRGFVVVCDGGPKSKLQFPIDEKKGCMFSSSVFVVESYPVIDFFPPTFSARLSRFPVALVQPFLCLQVCVPADASFNVEIVVSDDRRVRRRLMLSTAFKDVSTNPLHAQLPLACVPRDQWLNLCVDCAQLSADCFRQPFRAIEALTIAAHCTLRKVFRYGSVAGDCRFRCGNHSVSDMWECKLSKKKKKKKISIAVLSTSSNQCSLLTSLARTPPPVCARRRPTRPTTPSTCSGGLRTHPPRTMRFRALLTSPRASRSARICFRCPRLRPSCSTSMGRVLSCPRILRARRQCSSCDRSRSNSHSNSSNSNSSSNPDTSNASPRCSEWRRSRLTWRRLPRRSPCQSTRIMRTMSPTSLTLRRPSLRRRPTLARPPFEPLCTISIIVACMAATVRARQTTRCLRSPPLSSNSTSSSARFRSNDWRVSMLARSALQLTIRPPRCGA